MARALATAPGMAALPRRPPARAPFHRRIRLGRRSRICHAGRALRPDRPPCVLERTRQLPRRPGRRSGGFPRAGAEGPIDSEARIARSLAAWCGRPRGAPCSRGRQSAPRDRTKKGGNDARTGQRGTSAGIDRLFRASRRDQPPSREIPGPCHLSRSPRHRETLPGSREWAIPIRSAWILAQERWNTGLAAITQQRRPAAGLPT